MWEGSEVPRVAAAAAVEARSPHVWSFVWGTGSRLAETDLRDREGGGDGGGQQRSCVYLISSQADHITI